MTFLIFADLHQFEQNLLKKICCPFDAIVLLGDINGIAIQNIMNAFPDKPIYGIYGSRDSYGLFESINEIMAMQRKNMGLDFKYPVKNLNLTKETMGGISFTGLEGSVKYSPEKISFEQEKARKVNYSAIELPSI